MMRRLPLLGLLALAACNAADRVAEIGRGPQLAAMDNAGTTISMPMPPPPAAPTEANSLWRTGSRTFLRDQRAAQVGDIVTVLVQIEDRAQLQNTTERSRANSESLGIPRFLGIESGLGRFVPGGFDPSRMVEGASDMSNRGAGAIQRTESVTMRVAATVTQTLPNGNLVVGGRQQVRVNNELRDLTLSGIIRPQDIGSDNTVRHDRLAEARIAYGGRGIVSDVQQPRYGTQLLDIIMPF
jgi:flagellar L-ring protein precursor FlgH